MSEELTLESLELKKDLDKMTQKELRELCIEKITQITGASGMSKEELLPAIKEVLGIEEEEEPKNPFKEQIVIVKKDIASLREKKTSTTDRTQREILRKKINRLKKRSRRLAAASV
ncbi:hypothetical protein [Desulfovibrio ferrophilus]|uniref:Rho termination factor N-terminal domain-containing protein n=1 Tax=Desulfovibrio ferrophilus TaxID=241368 RepID=A0A2Z6B2D6_9BACT|nr:hypothetical protein [Desulfovibrio ferrophilus]BBD09608.1 uncharacterized protein DFE_2882 [Desulfovibrio ferrophilus]